MKKIKGRIKRHKIIRKKVTGTKDKPRLCVFRSGKNLYAQLIDDMKGHTLFSFSTNTGALKTKVAYGGNVKAAASLGEAFAKRAKEKGFNKIVFDRAGYLYHGRVKAFAEGARKNGLVFEGKK
ncbi:MAG: 50S ribosomal protein L18 [Candidatus Omnitrophota bacterium]|nr:MAG: 50S ribosomal protein L18 [Candidatus Omnitrophota bacterium]